MIKVGIAAGLGIDIKVLSRSAAELDGVVERLWVTFRPSGSVLRGLTVRHGRSRTDTTTAPSKLASPSPRRRVLCSYGAPRSEVAALALLRGLLTEEDSPMAVVGDQVQVPARKVGEAARQGVVTGVVGSLLRVQWSSGEESTVVPSVGSLMVVGKARQRSGNRARNRETTAATTAKKRS